MSEGESHNGLMVLPLGPLRILDCGIMFWDLTGRLFGPCVKVLLDGADGSLHTTVRLRERKIVKTDAAHSHGGPHTLCHHECQLPRP